jgi:thiamine-monophosphate kinase
VLACLLAGGDDYELCFTAPTEREQDIRTLATALEVALTRVGTIEAQGPLKVRDEAGRALVKLPRAFDHLVG